MLYILTDATTWLALIGDMKDSLWSVDLFRCESIVLKSYWVMVVMDLFTRRLVGFGVEPADLDGVAACRMFNHAKSGPLPKHLSTDNDPLFRFHRWRANLRVLEIDEIKTVPFVPCPHAFVERLIGTIRREYLDHVLFWNRVDLQRKLARFARYYNHVRVHSALARKTPAEQRGRTSPPVADLQQFSWQAHCHGLFHTPIAA
jgi:putative transposase